jgi:hypothetical protein
VAAFEHEGQRFFKQVRRLEQLRLRRLLNHCRRWFGGLCIGLGGIDSRSDGLSPGRLEH